jgi:hypothetical protein
MPRRSTSTQPFGTDQPVPPHLIHEHRSIGLSPAWTTFSAPAHRPVHQSRRTAGFRQAIAGCPDTTEATRWACT